MYYKLRQFELSDRDQQAYGADDLTVMMDEHANGYVINHSSNGLRAGDRVRSRRSSTDPDALTFSFTDDHTTQQSIRLAEAGRSREHSQIHNILGQLSIVNLTLPRLQAGDTTVDRYESSLRQIALDEQSAINPSKKQAVADLEQAIAALAARGHEVPAAAKDASRRAAIEFSAREADLARQRETNRERSTNLDYELRNDRMTRQRLATLALKHASISDAPDSFLREASNRITKPGNLTVNNAWYNRNQDTSWSQLILAEEGWEPLYGSLMRPISSLERQPVKKHKRSPGLLLARYSARLLALEDVIDLSRIGGDYDALADDLMEQLFKIEDLVINDQITQSKSAASEYKFLLRYRARPGDSPPEQWYGGLPNIRSGRETSDNLPVPDDPFEGIYQD